MTTNNRKRKRFGKTAAIIRDQRRLRRSGWLTAIGIAILILALSVATVMAAVKMPQIALLVPMLTLAVALALQRYTASFFSYFVIVFSGIYVIGDRIRIGNIKGDVREVGLLHTTLEEVGEDEKLGGELTGRILYLPNLIILDQPVLNYSKDYSMQSEAIASDFMFDEVRIPITLDSNVEKASALLEDILKSQEETYVKDAKQKFQDGYPRFLGEAMNGPRMLIFVEPQRIWIKGKFVAPVRNRNDVKSNISLQFIKETRASSDIKLA